MSDHFNQKKEFTFIWKVENFQSCVQKNGEFLKSPAFTADSLDKTEWCLKVFPKGNVGYKGCISVYLRRTKTDSTLFDEFNLDYIMEVIGADGETLASKNTENRVFRKDEGWGWDDLISEELLDKNSEILTIRCHIVKNELVNIPNSQCCIRTKIGLDRNCFKWNVRISETPLWKQSRNIFQNEDYQIEIISKDVDDISINIRKLDKVNCQLLTCKISLLDLSGVERASSHKVHLFDTCGTITLPTLIKKSQLKANESKYLKDNTFTLKCDFSVSNGKVLEEVEAYQCDLPNDDADTLSNVDTFSALQNDLRFLYASKKDTDVKLSADNEILLAHKAILIARSPVFSTMFETDMIECQTGIVDIPDVEAKILKSFIEFLYTGSVGKLNYEYASKLIVVADKYQVLSLKEKCALFLMSELSVDNVCDIFVISDMVRHIQLKLSAVDYMKGHTDAVLSSDNWSRLIENNVKLATEIIRMFSAEFSARSKGKLVK